MATGGHQILFQGKTTVAWMPKDGPHSLVISLTDYRVFHKTAKTVHIDEFELIQQSQCLPQQMLSVTKSMSHLLHKQNDLEFIWYGIVDPKETTNVYGNVSFVLDVMKFMSHCQHSFYIYYVETVDYKTCSISHILFSRKHYDYLTKYDPSIFGGPWFIDPAGRHCWLSNARGFDGKSSVYGHRLEFMLEFGQDDARWLYNESVPIPVDHQSYASQRHICLRNRKVLCNSPFSRERTTDILVAQGFTQFENEVPTSQLPSSGRGEETAQPQDYQQREQLSGVLSSNTQNTAVPSAEPPDTNRHTNANVQF
ncbi:uncharacterized protein LOC135203871 [Macrobrachium nipponense]|uniref:uncharacterized protein LOC135203871 n=1 Tax=Macrobrachium nipponense TaxID=159736 RepID=UPI0030C8A350